MSQGAALGNAIGILDTSFQGIANKLNQLKVGISTELDTTIQAVVEMERQSALTLQRMQQVQTQSQSQVVQQGIGPVQRNTAFNLKKLAQGVPPMVQPQQSQIDTSSFDGFYHFLMNSDYETARNAILSEKNSDSLSDAIKDFYSPESTESDKALIAAKVFEVLRAENGEENMVQGTPETVNNKGNVVANESIKNIVLASEQKIKDMVKAEKNNFNLKKYAQSREIVLWGPDSKRISPFNESFLESDWNAYERNKGWGFRIGDLWGIDFETIWRENIMDKYSRPYRDNEGNWVGGYIQKRFEVDKNIPALTNMQLKPGEIRKQRPAELGLIEARMQLARDKNSVVDGNDVVFATQNLDGAKKGEPKIVNASFNLSKKNENLKVAIAEKPFRSTPKAIGIANAYGRSGYPTNIHFDPSITDMEKSLIDKGSYWAIDYKSKTKLGGVKSGPAINIYIVDDIKELNNAVKELNWNSNTKLAFLPKMKTLDELEKSRHTIYNDHYFNGKPTPKGNHKYCPYCNSHLKEDNSCPNQRCSHLNMAVGVPQVGGVLSKPIPKNNKPVRRDVNIQLAAILGDTNDPIEEKDNKIPKLQEFETTVEVNGGNENDMDSADNEVEHSDPECFSDKPIDQKHIHHLHGTWDSLCGDE